MWLLVESERPSTLLCCVVCRNRAVHAAERLEHGAQRGGLSAELDRAAEAADATRRSIQQTLCDTELAHELPAPRGVQHREQSDRYSPCLLALLSASFLLFLISSFLLYKRGCKQLKLFI